MDTLQGSVLTLRSGKTVVVNKLIGKGGQGAVYDVSLDNKHYALKWYLPEYLRQINQKRFYANLLDNLHAGSPSDQFLWMLDISDYTRNSFGYLMDLRPQRYSSFTSILNAQNKIRSYKVQLIAAKNICAAFQTLHRAGYSYQDINDGNFFIDTNTGDVLICDNDNVAPYDVWMGIAGKDRYMAPEVVLGVKHAGMESDLFSMAVILYMLFFISHPLEGRRVHACPCLTAKYLRRFYAKQPVFVYDPVDDSNRPTMGIDNNIIRRWPLYSQKLRDLFIRSFTDGLRDASFRVRENEWIECFSSLQDNLIICPSCGNEQFYRRASDDSPTFKCEACQAVLRRPFVWINKTKEKSLFLGAELLDSDMGYDNKGIVTGKVIESKKHPGLWGIQNLTTDVWDVTLSNGKMLNAGFNDIVPLFRQTVIQLNDKKIYIDI